jgi:hypothetical protein
MGNCRMWSVRTWFATFYHENRKFVTCSAGEWFIFRNSHESNAAAAGSGFQLFFQHPASQGRADQTALFCMCHYITCIVFVSRK